MCSYFDSEVAIRLGCFAGILAVMAIAEFVSPRRALTLRKGPRWLGNLSLALLNSVVLRLLVPAGGAGVALFAESRGWGLLQHVALPDWTVVTLCVVVLDFAIYLQHVLFHAAPILWRLHKVHHADVDFDVTTAVRFHTFEIVLSFGIRSVVILLLGAPAVAVLLFEILLNGTAMFNHSNVRLPLRLDRMLRLIVVTPDMHRVHHSVIKDETDSNYGFNLPWWDFLLRTYKDQPQAGHEGMIVGLPEHRGKQTSKLWWMLVLPFCGEKDER